MRLAFPNGEHDEVSVGKGTLTIGSSPGDNVTLEDSGIQPGHAVIIVDRRGITLNIEAAPAEATVNGRPVVEKAILHLGDTLAIGSVAMVLQAEEDQIRHPRRSGRTGAPDSTSPKYHLRGISGYHQGRIIPILRRLRLGQKDSCDLAIPDAKVAAELAEIEVDAGGIYLRPLGDEAIEVNGNRVEDIILNPGDQLTFGDHRFLLETPGFVPGKAYVRAAEGHHAGNTQVFATPVMSEAPAESPYPSSDEPVETRAGARDAVVVTVCVLLSAAMLVWLFFLS